jgi:hypothetical protein
VNRIFFETVIAGDNPNDTAHIPADIIEIADRKAVVQKSSDKFLVTLIYDLQIIRVVLLEVAVGSRRRAIQTMLQFSGNFYADKESFIRLCHLTVSFFLEMLFDRTCGKPKPRPCDNPMRNSALPSEARVKQNAIMLV